MKDVPALFAKNAVIEIVRRSSSSTKSDCVPGFHKHYFMCSRRQNDVRFFLFVFSNDSAPFDQFADRSG